jgi:signal transduction histidine kinase
MVNDPRSESSVIDPLLLSNFVHQIINPLNGVVGTLDNIIDGTISDGGRRKQKLEAVRAQLSHSIEMIRNLAFLSQIASDAGTAGLIETANKVCIPQIIIEAAQFFQEAGRSKKIHISLTDDSTQYIVRGHADLLRQVFINIFDNGIKYSDPDTEIRVTPRPQKSTEQLFIEIESRGSGFENEERERLFELGYRGEAARQATSSGSGIGLFICRRILEKAHEARIEAERASSGTTLFRIRFPSYTIGAPYAQGKNRS